MLQGIIFYITWRAGAYCNTPLLFSTGNASKGKEIKNKARVCRLNR